MTAPSLLPDATRCPECSAALPGPGRCPACGLHLSGPAATRLWEVDCELLRLGHTRERLLDERGDLLAVLRLGTAQPGSPVSEAAPAVSPPSAPPPADPRQEWTPQRVQNLLLTLGGLLLAVAALVFAAVTYERLGAGGRAVVLALLSLVAAASAPRLRAHGLAATAETVGAVTLVLAGIDAYGLRTLGLAPDSDLRSYAAVSSAVLAVATAAYARVVPLRVLHVAAVVLAQLPAPLLLARTGASAATVGAVLAVLAAADLALLAADRRRPRLPRSSRTALWAGAGVVTAAALLASLLASTGDQPGAGARALVACAAVLAGAGALVRSRPLRAPLTGAAVVVLGTAAYALSRGDERTAVLVLAATGLLAVVGAARLPRPWRTGPVLGSLVVSTGALLLVAQPVVDGVLAPFAWPLDPWSLPEVRGLRGALAPELVWTGTLAAPIALATGALATAVAGRALHRTGLAAAPLGVLTTAAAVLLPLGLDLAYSAGLGLLLLAGAALVGAGVVLGRRSRSGAGSLAVAGTAVVLLTAAWSTAAQGATLVVLPVAALLAAAVATASRPGPLPAVAVALAGLLATAEVGAVGAARGLSADQVGALLVVAVGVLLGAAAVLDRTRRGGAEAAAVLAAATALLLAAADVGWLSWTLTCLALVALAGALRPDRRLLAPLGGLLLSASSWVRLADAGVSAPEPYLLPVAALALVLGHVRRRSVPGTTSWAAYGPGLTLVLVPSLVASADDEALTRPLLVGLAAVAVLLVGARTRLQAPLAVGGLVLAADALLLLGPYAAALPRWMSLGAAGALLLVVGATYEQRRRDVTHLRQRFDALA